MQKITFTSLLILLATLQSFAQSEITSNLPTADIESVDSMTENDNKVEAEKPVLIINTADSKDPLPPSSLTTTELDDISFIYHYYKTIESSLNRNRRVGKLGRKEIDGLKQGTFYYRCKLSGWNEVTITMTYNNYSDFNFILNGTTTVVCNWKANGAMTGTILASGPAAGEFNYNLIIEEGMETGGHYMVDRPENPFKLQVPISVILAFADRDIELDEKCSAEKK